MKLTIGIPTYNRFRKLENLLQEISNQITNFQDKNNLEIVVSNNSSSDDTSAVIEKYEYIFPCSFKYFIQKENIGFDRNVDFLFKNSSGDFLWILSDDDVLIQGAIQEVYNGLLKSPNVVFAFVNYNVNLSGQIIASSIKNDGNLLINSKEAMLAINFANSLISSCIFNVSKWNSINTSVFFDSCWIHMYVARAILNDGMSLLFTKPLIEMMQENFYESRINKNRILGIEFYLYAHLKLVEFCDSLCNFAYPQKICQQAIKFCLRGDLGHIINYKLFRKRYEAKEILNIIKYFYPYRRNHLSYYFLFIPALIIPGNIYKLLYSIKVLFYGKSFNKISNK